MELIKAAAIRHASHGDVISLCAGQPSTPAPKAVRDAAVRAIEGHVLGYTEATGIRPLREAIAQHYADSYDLAIDPDQVVVATGSSGGFTAVSWRRSTSAMSWRCRDLATRHTATR